MNMDVTSVGLLPPSAAQLDPVPRRVSPHAAVTSAVVLDQIPDAPPAEVLEAMSAAARAYRTLRAQGRELRFAQDEETGRLSIEVWDLDGNLLRTIPPSKLLDVATGGTL